MVNYMRSVHWINHWRASSNIPIWYCVRSTFIRHSFSLSTVSHMLQWQKFIHDHGQSQLSNLIWSTHQQDGHTKTIDSLTRYTTRNFYISVIVFYVVVIYTIKLRVYVVTSYRGPGIRPTIRGAASCEIAFGVGGSFEGQMVIFGQGDEQLYTLYWYTDRIHPPSI